MLQHQTIEIRLGNSILAPHIMQQMLILQNLLQMVIGLQYANNFQTQKHQRDL